ncbi:MAG: bifunctional phosphoribosylaminoimidazolecarboxamide formyltransferase/IMP cyclohydrolase [Actinomycetota bacterium]
MKIKRALISVSDKTGIEDFARGLVAEGVSLIASGGTQRILARAGIPVGSVSEATGAPEILGGRVKTLHPKIHGGILADRRNLHHVTQLKEQEITPIDLVVCNLYPFAKTIEAEGVTDDEAIEQIDIGGPAMVRAAAKNFQWVGVVVNPDRYPAILEEMGSRAGSLSDETRASLAAEAFAHTASYDVVVSRWMNRGAGRFPQTLFIAMDRETKMRYGENPHQDGAFYADGEPGWQQLAGKELSFTNLLDLDAAWRVAAEFEETVVAIIKHTNPCGVATGESVEAAYRRAVECDPRSAFGGIVATNREIDGAMAGRMLETVAVTDVVVAPSFTKQALQALKVKKNLRVIRCERLNDFMDIKAAAGGFLLQDRDQGAYTEDEMIVAGSTQPNEQDWADMLFAWKVCKHVKSNAAVLAINGQAFGVGAGQMSRVEAVALAVQRAGDRAKGCALATDGFFPFRDGIDVAVEGGATSIIQPGGSVRDSEVIIAADNYRVPMVFTGRRHFRH